MKKKASDSKIDIVAELKDEFKRHATALMEHMTKEVRTVAEGHDILARKLDKVESDIGSIKTDLRTVKLDVGALRLEMKVVKSEVHSISMAIIDTSHTVDRLEKKVDGALENHDKRITKLEEKVLV